MDESDVETVETREIKCPVHRYIPLSKLATSIIDTPQFQRLRYLKQLGTSYYVWPGAAHNRFEHSIGVYYLAGMMVKRLKKSQPELKITERDVRCVEIAGLCHDLGHGPFSHVWDNTFIPTALPGKQWKHEDASEMMLDYLVEENNIDLKPDEVRFIKDLISGEKRYTLTPEHGRDEKQFLFEIVANRVNGIDVDKFDYLARDTQAISRGTITDLDRLINSARVIGGKICYSEKNAATVYSLFQERFLLHKNIYNHKTAKAIEYMIVDALLIADPHLKISERIHDPKRYVYLTDDILNEVERSECPELESTRALIRRIRTRDLYRLVDKEFLPWVDREFWKTNLTPERIVEKARALRCPDLEEPKGKKLVEELEPGHIIVDLTNLHHGMGSQFPLENCMFYGKYNRNKAFPPRRQEDISHLLPEGFGEIWNRIFARDGRFHGVIQAASRALIEELKLQRNLLRLSTPEVVRTPRAQSSMSSILSDHETATGPANTNALLATPAATTVSAAVSPLVNPYMTVPPTFSPVKGKNVGKGRTNRGEGTSRSTRKRSEMDDGGEDEDEARLIPLRKKKKTN